MISRIKESIFGSEENYTDYTLKNGETVKIFIPEKCEKSHARTTFSRRIEISKHILDNFEPQEMRDAIVYHELGHTQLISFLLTISVFIIVLAVLASLGLTVLVWLLTFLTSLENIIIALEGMRSKLPTFRFLFFGFVLLRWFIEAYCDRYSINRNDRISLLNALEKIRKLEGEGGWCVRFKRNILHPPLCIRRKLIEL